MGKKDNAALSDLLSHDSTISNKFTRNLGKLKPMFRELIQHLQSTGTGVSKLEILTDLAEEARNSVEFLAAAKLAMPPGTWTKIDAYVNKEEPAPVKPPEATRNGFVEVPKTEVVSAEVSDSHLGDTEKSSEASEEAKGLETDQGSQSAKEDTDDTKTGTGEATPNHGAKTQGRRR